MVGELVLIRLLPSRWCGGRHYEFRISPIHTGAFGRFSLFAIQSQFDARF